MTNRIKYAAHALLGSYSGILFGSNLWIGAALLLLTLINPNIGMSGFISVLSAYMFSRLLGKSESFLSLNYYIYNPLLVGLSLGTSFKVDSVSIFFIIIMGILTFLITSCMAHAFSTYLKLPILSLPFVICSFIAHLAAYRYSRLFVQQLYIPPSFPLQESMPEFLRGFFTSMGSIFCIPNVLTGVGIFIILLFFSRILSLLAISGYFAGVVSATILIGSSTQALMNPDAFNYILISTAIGGVFLIPSLRGYTMATIAVIISVPVIEAFQIFWQKFGLPVFALPFNLITLITIYALGISGSKMLTIIYKKSPEETLDNYITMESRFPQKGIRVNTPFAGTWSLWQGFDGHWTHKGIWKYALDFVVADENGKNFNGDGSSLEDYYAFKKPILSPVNGEVVAKETSIADNQPGKVNETQNWGNYLVIYDYRQFYVLLSHFSADSIKVNVGEKVKIGQLLGLCGNSGYSPQPHIHMQIQLESKPGAPTIPFTLSSWLDEAQVWQNGIIPAENTLITGTIASKQLANSFEFLIGTSLTFEYIINGVKIKDVELQVGMSSDSTRYLTDGKATLQVGQRDNTFFAWNLNGSKDSALTYLYASAASLPLLLTPGMTWSDRLSMQMIDSQWKRKFYLFLSSFKHGAYETKVNYKAVSNRLIEGNINLKSFHAKTKLELDSKFQINQIEYSGPAKNVILRRKDEKNI